jgi:hypothetical protein
MIEMRCMPAWDSEWFEFDLRTATAGNRHSLVDSEHGYGASVTRTCTRLVTYSRLA